MNASKKSAMSSALRAWPGALKYMTTLRGSSLCGTRGSNGTWPIIFRVDASINAACVTSSNWNVTKAMDFVGCFLTPATNCREPVEELGEEWPPPPLPQPGEPVSGGGPAPDSEAAICSKCSTTSNSESSAPWPWRQKSTSVSGSVLCGDGVSTATCPIFLGAEECAKTNCARSGEVKATKATGLVGCLATFRTAPPPADTYGRKTTCVGAFIAGAPSMLASGMPTSADTSLSGPTNMESIASARSCSWIDAPSLHFKTMELGSVACCLAGSTGTPQMEVGGEPRTACAFCAVTNAT
mmetsp:Transcript_9234/g.29325  ORF Transcript_9234/g.29325 Transcript_9234/m.29325 type:complete len:297 (-) Transcript_9234:97-987(-)